MNNPVPWFEIYVADMTRAKVFYEAVLGFAFTKVEQPPVGDIEEMWFFPADREGGGASGALVKMTGAPIGPGGTMVYFAASDCGETARKAPSAGGTLVREKTSLGPFGHMAIVTDTEGNMVGLHSMQ